MGVVATALFIVTFVLPALLFLVGAAVLQSAHLLFAGLVMGLGAAISYVVMKGAARRKQQEDPGPKG